MYVAENCPNICERRQTVTTTPTVPNTTGMCLDFYNWSFILKLFIFEMIEYSSLSGYRHSI